MDTYTVLNLSNVTKYHSETKLKTKKTSEQCTWRKKDGTEEAYPSCAVHPHQALIYCNVNVKKGAWRYQGWEPFVESVFPPGHIVSGERLVGR